MALDIDEILTDLWAIHYHQNPKLAEAEASADDDFDATLKDLGLDAPGQWEDA